MSYLLLLLVAGILLLLGSQVIFRGLAIKRITIFDYQRGVLYRDGVFARVVAPGSHWTSRRTQIFPVDLRKQLMQLPGQEILTTDSITLKVSAVVEYAVTDATLSLHASANLTGALYSLAQQALRSAVADLPLERLIASRTAVDTLMQTLLLPGAAELGVSVSSVQVRDIMLPSDLRRAYAQALTAQKEGAAALERARGETASLRALANAARMLQDHPGLLQLRAVQAVESSRGAHTLQLDLSGPSAARSSRSDS